MTEMENNLKLMVLEESFVFSCFAPLFELDLGFSMKSSVLEDMFAERSFVHEAMHRLPCGQRQMQL